MALVILAKPVRNVRPATLAPVGYLDGLRASGALAESRFALVGYGMNEQFQLTGDRRIADAEFQTLLDAYLVTSANANMGNGGVCFNDSGGPTFHESDGTEYLVATHIFGFGDCGEGTNGDYRVDTESARAFIQSVLAAYP